MKISELCEAERPREKMLSQGAGKLGNAELLAVLVRTGTTQCSALDLAQKLLSLSGGSLSRLFSFSAAQMETVSGIKSGKSAAILAAAELGKRYLSEAAMVERTPIVTSRQAFDIMYPLMKGLTHEECWIVLLNNHNYVIDKVMLSLGGDQATTMDVRKAVRTALEKGASSLILVHNHPSGNPNPSNADIAQTASLRAAARTCEIDLIDHIVISDGCYFSFEQGREISVV